MKTDESFKLVYDAMTKKASKHKFVNAPDDQPIFQVFLVLESYLMHATIESDIYDDIVELLGKSYNHDVDVDSLEQKSLF